MKNLLLVAALSAVLLALPGCDKPIPQQPAEAFVPLTASEPPARTLRPVPARYQIVFSPHVRADTFLLDTQKGRVWQMTKFSDLQGEPSAWAEMDVIDSTGETGIGFNQFLQQNSLKSGEHKGKR